MIMTAEQVRAARALLRIEQADLSRRANVSIATLRRLEAPGGEARVSAATATAVRTALEAAGAEFIDDGVRRRPPARRSEQDAVYQRLRSIARQSAAFFKDLPAFSEHDLYDDHGLPR